MLGRGAQPADGPLSPVEAAIARADWRLGFGCAAGVDAAAAPLPPPLPLMAPMWAALVGRARGGGACSQELFRAARAALGALGASLPGGAEHATWHVQLRAAAAARGGAAGAPHGPARWLAAGAAAAAAAGAEACAGVLLLLRLAARDRARSNLSADEAALIATELAPRAAAA